MLAVVLGGGNAVGACHRGIIEALEAAGVEPDWMAGSSIAAQTKRTLRTMRQLWDARESEAPGAVYRLTYAYQPDETAIKSFDLSRSSLDRRWGQGRADMQPALRQWRGHPPVARGLAVHDGSAARELADA